MTTAGAAGGDARDLVDGLAVIRAFDAHAPVLGAADVAARAGVSEDEARRLLAALVAQGYVDFEARAYRLTPLVLELGVGYLASLRLPRVAQPHLEALAYELGESVSAAVLDRASIVYVGRTAAPRLVSTRITFGTRLPAHASAMGRAMLAQLPEEEWDARLEATGLEALTTRTVTAPVALRESLRETLRQGWCEVDGEVEDGLRSIAVPVHGLHGVAAAIGVTTLSGHGDAATLAARLLATAREIEDDLRADDLAARGARGA
ncbi:IclR family transcriptional regulator domain-containing protein [Demequina mangrovi]|uniref:Transcriptional regulator, IclR family n=1 Tax=Demequina mangrovi TaxID=1043493 RepID=A0A1H6Z357_9MICO|nr:IclR family transcriptional regulator C-terminal domain-containing protein [Demequina mangrovi]SEJ47929.1 transcriptional regulator, IclR family [Demequina mangrovi]